MQSARIFLCVLAIACLIHEFSSAAHADDVYWSTATSGNWSDGTKWSTGSPPDPNDAALITVAGNYTVTVDVDVQVTSLTLGGAPSGTQTLAVTGVTIACDDVFIGGSGRWRFTQASPTVTGAGTFVNEGVFESTANSGVFTITMPATNRNTMNLKTGNSGSSYTFSVLTNEVGATITLGPEGNGQVTLAADRVINQGTITGQGIRQKHIDAKLINSGTLNIVKNTTIDKPDAHHSLGGTVNLTGGNLEVNQSGLDPNCALSGTVNLMGRTFQVNGGVCFYAGGSISGSGAFELGDNTIFDGSTPYTNNVRFELGANCTVLSEVINEARIVHTGNSGTLNFGRVINSGIIQATTGNSTTTICL